MNLADLKKPFSPMVISWRCGATNSEKTKGIALAYLNARDVMERLDEVCGVDGWQCRYPFIGCCDIGIRIPLAPNAGLVPMNTLNDWVWKSNGAGQSDIEAEKGRYSVAFKRAAVLWGIGRYLYDLPNVWVPIEKHGNSYRFPDSTINDLTTRLEKWQASYFK